MLVPDSSTGISPSSTTDRSRTAGWDDLRVENTSNQIAVPGVLDRSGLAATAASIADLQLDSGQIPWFVGGHCDPWNHIECAMALDAAGLHSEALAAYRWLVDIQKPDGSWHQYYIGDQVEQPKFDANPIAYIATGVWHRWLLHQQEQWLHAMWPVVDAALSWVVKLQRPEGDITWARHPDGTPYSFSLLTGSCSISHSLRCGLKIANQLNVERPGWSEALDRLIDCIQNNEKAFAPKKRWAMDWYYPALTGALDHDAALARLNAGEGRFVLDDYGVRCVSDQDWCTSAETCEAVMAYLAVGQRKRALQLFEAAQVNRDVDGAYFTGFAVHAGVHFPGGERSSYTAAAVVLAADALSETTAGSKMLWSVD